MWGEFCDTYSPSAEEKLEDKNYKLWFFYGYLYRCAEVLNEKSLKDWDIKDIMKMLIDDLSRNKKD